MPTISPWRACRLTPLIISRRDARRDGHAKSFTSKTNRPDARRALRVTIGHLAPDHELDDDVLG